ncbi:hypothetical protein [Streptomyces sp. NPDC001594]|uniref:hypothetical protein n=1 Tax=Streptomyces sp. NPDC001594 TaxID=3364590 RepID=UPI0036AAE34D
MLDVAVHEAFAEQASEVNNQGVPLRSSTWQAGAPTCTFCETCPSTSPRDTPAPTLLNWR